MYSQYPKYEKYIYEFIMKADRINTKGSEFEDLLYDIKRRKVTDNLTKIIKSDNVILGTMESSELPKAFKVFCAKDVKEFGTGGKSDPKQVRVFIDASGLVQFKNANYTCNRIDWLISYVMDAMVSYIYTMATNKIVNNSSIVNDGADCFMSLFTYIIDRLYKISSVPDLKRQVDYLAALYYQVNILEKDFKISEDTLKKNAIKMSNVDPKMAARADVMVDLKPETFKNINTFVSSLKGLGFKDIDVSKVAAYWMKAFGTGTILGMEYFPSFSAMLTDAYNGGYLNNQITIEKLTGPAMVKFVKSIIQIGESLS